MEKCVATRVSCGLQQGLAFRAGALWGEGARKIKAALRGVAGGGGAGFAWSAAGGAGKSILDRNTSPACPLPRWDQGCLRAGGSARLCG